VPGPECAAAAKALLAAGFASVDYVECRTAEGLEPVERFDAAVPARIFAAARLGRTRLIDNLPVEAGG
jgi:pantoate--beta-alanine ligase